jgi:hypothetical protein
LAGKIVEWSVNHLGLRIGSNDLQGLISAAAVDNHDTLCPSEPAECARDIRRFVIRNYEWRDIFDHGQAATGRPWYEWSLRCPAISVYKSS